MKVSVITVARNAVTTVADAIESVVGQSHGEIEHIVIDGASTDGTLDVIRRTAGPTVKLVSEADEGIYDAMNKGIRIADGDVVGILNADDIYQHEHVISRVAEVMDNNALDACYADLVYVRSDDITRVVRYWKSREYTPGLSFKGWMPAHPTFFVRRGIYVTHGMFDTTLKIQADLELTTRFLEVNRIRSIYVPEIWVRMRMGGVTNRNPVTMWRGNRESYNALKRHGLKSGPVRFFFSKFSMRIPQYFHRPG